MNAALAGQDVLPDIDPQFLRGQEGFGGESPAKYAGDNRLHVTFKRIPILNPRKSTDAGRAIYDEVDYITIYTPGSQLSVIEAPVSERDYAVRFRDRYEAWKKNQAEAITGTPLESWPHLFNKIGLVAELKYMNVHTVEQLANLADVYLQKLMGGNELRAKAAEWLNQNFGADAQMKKMEDEMAALKAQLAALTADKVVKANEPPPAAPKKQSRAKAPVEQSSEEASATPDFLK